jgi:hypothetical protein
MKGIYFGIILVGVSATAVARPELNAFINKPANSVPELLAQIKADKVVADRFMRHFSMTKDEVIEYIGGLRLGTIKESGYFTIYSAPENGVLKAHVSYFKKGTPAFVDSDGNAILRTKCGNPFVRGPVKAYASVEPTVEGGNDSVSVAVNSTTSTSVTTPVIDAKMPEIPAVVETLPSGPLTLKQAPTTTSSASGFNVGGAIAGLGAAASFVNRGSGTAPVPEPASMIALGVGAVALLRRRKK